MRIPIQLGHLAIYGVVAATTTNSTVSSGICLWTPSQRIEYPTCSRPRTYYRPSSPEKAWRGPDHCVNSTCIFSNQQIGDGIVLITSEKNAQIARGFPVPSRSPEANAPFDVAEVPGKGLGLVANRKIPKGEILLVRPLALIVQTAPHVGLEPGARDALYDIAVGRLPERGRELFMSQVGESIFDKIEKNCFQLYIDGSNESGSHLGCYPDVSRFNHDCRPK
ncbi:hypothetical protein GGS23DRAFT_564842 [Durotheca rogersii]|uniref:uncharacterized protein n=1 Tax=Durotheca rogersii TaxID=419775 RepID=UPI002220703E|nr:uncharacterized protein GGS23DRAFT_564842 [Durotheca rogersii]KAI5863659.1 hypothetical protein GGS23DRAFT_564842 [Durotheca rogersii]